MNRAGIYLALSLGLLFSCAEIKKAHHLPPRPNAIPQLHINGDSTAGATRISFLKINTVTIANIATTTFEIHFYNPNNKILEGEFEFPLADGQAITRYALDINGWMREGVVVEKAKARVAFENTVRKSVDPGLVEKTKGNNFRTRIYPLPAHGYRKILVAVEQTLDQVDKDLIYQLPLYAAQPIDTFSLDVAISAISGEPRLDENGMPLHFIQEEKNYVASIKENNFLPAGTVAIVLPYTNSNQDMVLTGNYDGQQYFYVNSRIEAKSSKKSKPTSIGVLWDISGSGDKRDLDKEKNLLREYLSQMSPVDVSLVPFNIALQPAELFTVSGNTSKLMERIDGLEYDGGTQFGSLDLSKMKFDEVLLFTDGLSTFGKEELVMGNFPVNTITSSATADYSNLKFIAATSNGHFVDLGKTEVATAIDELKNYPLNIVGTHYDPSEIEELVTQTTPVIQKGLSFAGKLKVPSASISIDLGFGKEIKETRKYTITSDETQNIGQVKRIWASMKINRLDLEFKKNKDAITQLGKEFSIVTQNTSLLVLDLVDDYVEHEIVPPVELQKEYYALLKTKQETEKDKEKASYDEAVQAMSTLKTWWNKRYPKPKAVTVDTITSDEVIDVVTHEGIADEGVATEPFLRLEVDSTNTHEMELFELSDSISYSAGLAAANVRRDYERGNAMYFTPTIVAAQGDADADGIADRLEEQKNELIAEQPSSIKLNKWQPNATYLTTLDKTAIPDRWSIYLSLKKEYGNQPSFFVDVASLFLQQGEKQKAILVLSNIAELKLEDAELLRIIANQLLEAGEKELSIITFRQILDIREEEPQAYRDLALAYNENGEYSKAVALLYKLVMGSWSERFGDVKGIALNEMNAIISAHPGEADISAIDKQFIYPMPVDIRIVIGWNTDNSDIDLWVTDPVNEKCSYEHTETAMGGRISRDVIQGYGPEEFMLKKAKKGDYKIDAHLFGDHRQTLGGPITIKAELFTDFGKPGQQRRTINLRVTSSKEIVNLGALKFGA